MDEDATKTASSNPLLPIALAGGVTFIEGAYTFAVTHQVGSNALFRSALFVIFLLFYARRSRYAWCVSLILVVCIGPTYLTSKFFTSQGRPPTIGNVIIAVVAIALAVIYLVNVKAKYYHFLRDRK